MELLNLCWAFFRVGLFTIGGGLVAIPIMQEYALRYGWITQEAFVNMIAVSESTPGPIGINMATYIGFSQYGLLGSILVTIAIVLPSYITIAFIHRYMHHVTDKPLTITVFKTIRPVVIGVILSAAFSIATVSILNLDSFDSSFQLLQLIDLKGFAVFVVFFGMMKFLKQHPVVYIALGALVGVVFF